MKRWVYRHRTVTGSPAVLEERLRADLPALLARAAGQPPNPPAGDGSFLLQLTAHVPGAPVHKTVRVRTGVATTSRGRLVIPVSWEADPLPHSFPTFDGTAELEPHSSAHGQIALVGTYRLPAGPLGAALDATVLHGVADRTVAQLVDGLAAALTGPHTAQVTPPASTPMRVRGVMTREPLVLHDDLPLRTAALLLFHYRVGGAPVEDDQGRLLGVLSEADLLEKQATPRTGLGLTAARSHRLRSAGTVGEACTRPVRVTDADTTLHDAAREMLDHRVARLVVLDDSRIAV